MNKHCSWQRILPVFFVIILSGIIPSLSLQPLYAQTNSLSLDQSYTSGAFQYYMWGNSTLEVTGAGRITETLYMYGTRIFTERQYALYQGATLKDGQSWPDDVEYTSNANRFDATRTTTGLAAGTYTAMIVVQQRQDGTPHTFPAKIHSITLYGAPGIGTPTLTSSTATSLTISATATNIGHGISGRIMVGSTWYTATVTGSTLSYTATGLSPYTSYAVDADVTSIEGTAGATATSFSTLGVAPTVTTQSVSVIASATATGNGSITSLGAPNPTAYGHCWANTTNPTIANSSNNLGAASATGAYISSLTGLAANTLYYVRAYVTNSISTTYGTQVSFTTAPGAPGTPTSTYITSTGFTVNWTAATGATGYYLDVSTSASWASYVTGYQNLPVGNVTSYAVTGLASNTYYFYRIRAYNSNGTSDNSTRIQQKTGPAAPAAGAATSITISAFTANWSASTGATSYRLDVSTVNTFASFVTGYNDLNVSTVLTYAVSGLSAGTTYYYRVRAVNSGGAGDNSAVITVETIPAAPTATAATSITTTGFSANWSAVTGAASYRLDVSTVNTFASFVTGYNDKNVGLVVTSAVVGLSSGTTYYYRLRSVNTGGTSAVSNTMSTTTYLAPTVTTQAVTAITVGTATGNGNVTVLGVPNPTQYGHCWALTSSPTTANAKTTLGAKSTTGAYTSSLTGLTAGTLYFVRAYATNAAGTVYGSEVSFTTTPAAPTATAATSITISGFTANWSAVTGAASYRLDVSTVSSFASYITGYTDKNVASVVSYAIASLTTGATYYYRVRAVNTGGTSANSGTITTIVYQTPTVVTSPVTAVTTTSATGNGNVTVLGVPTPTQHGHCWAITSNPTISNSHTSLGAKITTGAFTSSLTGLLAGTQYYVAAYATNAAGTSYDDDAIFVTTPPAPVANAATYITSTGFTANWSAATGTFSYRLDVSTVNTFASCITGYSDLTVGNVLTYAVSGLSTGTTYFYRVRAVNTGGTSASSNTISTSSYQTPTVTTQAVTSITATTATGNGNVTALGNPNPTQYGHCWGIAENPTTSDSKTQLGNKTTTGTFISGLTGLTAGTEYFVRAYATNSQGTSYGNEVSFETIPAAPVANNANTITTTGFTALWNPVTGATGYRIDVSISMGFGSYVAGFENLDVGNILGYPVTGLTAGTTYYYRVRAYNASGTGIDSNIMSVITNSNYNVNIDKGNITGVHIFTDETDYGIDPVSPMVLPAGFNGTFHAEKTDYVWELAVGSDSNIILNLAADTNIAFIGTYTYVDPVNPGFVYTGEPDIPIVAVAVTFETLVVPPPTLNPVGAVVIVFTGVTVSDLTISVPTGIWYVIAYYNDPVNGGLDWHHANPYPANGPMDVVFYNVPFGTKSNIPIIITGEDVTLPVELSSFTANVTVSNFVQLDWVTQSESGVSGYYIHRNIVNSLIDAVVVSPFVTAGNTSNEQSYSFTDDEVESGTWYYWLQNIDMDGQMAFHGSISVTVTKPGDEPVTPIIPNLTSLTSVFPNPFNPVTTISFHLAKSEYVTLDIFNIRGEKVRAIASSSFNEGTYRSNWNGIDDHGMAVSSGVYFLQMTAGKYHTIAKLVLMK